MIGNKFKLVKSEDLNEKAKLEFFHNSETDKWEINLDIYNLSSVHYRDVATEDVDHFSDYLRDIVRDIGDIEKL